MKSTVLNDISLQIVNQDNVLSSGSQTTASTEGEDATDNNQAIGVVAPVTPTGSKLPSIITQDSLDTLTSNDAHKLANVLQQQLDAINEELA